jgi:predicted phage terminase large subunit-like protein
MSTTASPILTSKSRPSWEQWPIEKKLALRDRLRQRLQLNPWSPHLPTSKQKAFLDLDCREALFGGAAGGGKSDCLLMAALQHVDVPGYAAILFRRTFADLSLPGALMDRAREWLSGTAARWNEQEHTWHFPSGASITFGYLETENHKYRYQSAEFAFVGFDELTQFTESQYTYLFSRLRRLAGSDVPLRMRAASNPGGVGHEWVRSRFIDAVEPGRVFVSAKLTDNPYLDQAEYRASLMNLDPVTREQLLAGNWMVVPEGTMFRREWFEIVEAAPAAIERWVRYWDKAGTQDGGDYTAGVLVGVSRGTYYVADVVHGQWSAAKRSDVMRQVTQMDAASHGRFSVWTEQEPGSGGKESAEATIRELAGYDVHAERVTGSKVIRANPLAAQAEAGNIKIVRGAWNHDYLQELCGFPNPGVHDDMVDATSGAFSKLAIPQSSGIGVRRYA